MHGSTRLLIAFLAILCGLCLLWSTSLFAITGRPYIDAPITTYNAVINSVGAILTKKTYNITEGNKKYTRELWTVVANAVFVGSTSRGSALLVSSRTVFTPKGEVDHKRLSEYRLRFGATVSSRQLDRRVRREEHRLDNVTFIKHPNYVPRSDPKFNPGGGNYGLVIMVLPYHLKNGVPLPIIKENTLLTSDMVLSVFSHGNQYDEPPKADVIMTDEGYELDKTSGYLRWTSMKFFSIWTNWALMSVKPMTPQELGVHFNVPPVGSDTFIAGPCDTDRAAPLLIQGNTLKIIEGVSMPAPTLALVGLHRASKDTCKRRTSESNPTSSFFDLRFKTYQDFLTKNLKITRP